MELALRREISTSKTINRAIGVIFFTLCMGLGAFVRLPLPFTPVPVTLQTFFVLLSGASLGPILGVGVQSGYLALGLLGFSVFTFPGSGLLYFAGPTGGYLAGFVLASIFTGSMLKRENANFLFVLITFAVADMLILASGTMWLKSLLGLDTLRAFIIGFLPFVIGDAIKVFTAAWLYVSFRPRIKNLF